MSSTSHNLRLRSLALCTGLLLTMAAVPVTGQEPPPAPGIGTTVNGAYVKLPTFTGTDRLQSIVVLRSDGRLIQAVLGPGLILDRSTTPATLRINITIPQPTGIEIIGLLGREIIAELPNQELPDAEGNHFAYTLSKTPMPESLKVYRDGVRMLVGNDYILTGSTITFLGHYDGAQYARVVADYRTKDQ